MSHDQTVTATEYPFSRTFSYTGGSPNNSGVQIESHDSKDQPSKLWGVALAVGLIALTLGISSGVGLLQSYQVIHLPSSWFTSAISWIGNTSHYWSLWTIALGGIVAGAVLIPPGIYKIYKLAQTETELNENIIHSSRLQMETNTQSS